MRSSDLDAVRIPQRRAGGRYGVDAVDDLLKRCRAALHARERGADAGLTARDILLAELPTARLFAPGYDADAVDQLLDEVAEALGGPPAGPVPDPGADEAAVLEALDLMRGGDPSAARARLETRRDEGGH